MRMESKILDRIPKKHSKRLRHRMKTEPYFLFLMMHSLLVFTLHAHREDFATDVAFMQCHLYLVDVLLPRYYFGYYGRMKWNDEVLRGLALMAIAVFVAGEKFSALSALGVEQLGAAA